MRMKPIMRGSSSTTRIRFRSRGAARGNLPGLLDKSSILIAQSPELIAEGLKDFFLFAGWHHFDEVDSPHWVNDGRHITIDVMYFLVIPSAWMIADNARICDLRQAFCFYHDRVIICHVQTEYVSHVLKLSSEQSHSLYLVYHVPACFELP